jgi:hypothetical protein
MVCIVRVVTAVQAQWDIMAENLRASRQDSFESPYVFVGSHFGCATPQGQTCPEVVLYLFSLISQVNRIVEF